MHTHILWIKVTTFTDPLLKVFGESYRSLLLNPNIPFWTLGMNATFCLSGFVSVANHGRHIIIVAISISKPSFLFFCLFSQNPFETKSFITGLQQQQKETNNNCNSLEKYNA